MDQNREQVHTNFSILEQWRKRDNNDDLYYRTLDHIQYSAKYDAFIKLLKYQYKYPALSDEILAKYLTTNASR